MNIQTQERLITDYEIYQAIEDAVKDDELDFGKPEDLHDHDPDLAPLLKEHGHLTRAIALMRRYKQEERLEQLSEIYPKEYTASAGLIWSIDKVTRNHLMANELLFLKIDPMRLQLIPEAFYEIKDKSSKAYGEIRPLFPIPDEVLLSAFFILPYNKQLKAIEQSDRATLSAKLIELLTTYAKELSWPISDQFKRPVQWTVPGEDPSAKLHNSLFRMEGSGVDTYVEGHVISSFLAVTDHKITGLQDNPPTGDIMKLAESVCESYAQELTRKSFKPTKEEQKDLQKEAAADQEKQTQKYEQEKTA